MYYIKDFVGRSIFFYKKNKEYRKTTNIIFLLFIFFNVVLFYAYLFGGWRDGSFFFCLIFGYIVIILSWVGESFRIFPPDFIDQDMDKLPDRVGKYSVSIQYTPPKGLNPSEVGLLYDLKSNSTNFDCLFYKWEYEGFIKIEDRGNGSVLFDRIGEIGDDVPSYEKHYWNIVFGVEHKNSVNWKWNMLKLDQKVASDLHFELLNYCIKKGILYKKQDPLFIISLIGVFGGGFVFGYALGVLVIIFSFVYIFGALGKQGKNYFGKEIGRTDKGNELLAHIVGYKYWLEKCEEEQVKKIMENDPGFKNKALPYLVALRMDWKFLDGKFNK